MNSPEDDNLSIDNEEKDDEFQEKLDFEESELLEDNTASPQKNDSATASPVANEDAGSQAAGENEEEAKPKEKIIKLISVKNSGEDGELNDADSDDDLEEGELKDEDDPVNQSLDVLVRRNEQKNIPCKFYLNGQCTWGDQCRFMHSGEIARNNHLSSQPKPPIRNLSTKYYQQKPPYGNTDNRGDLDPRYDDYHADGYSYNGSRGGYQSSRDKPYDNRPYYDKDYERKRRLALESAPWNQNDEYRTSDYHKSQSSKPVPRESSFHNNHSSSSSFSDFSSEKSFNQSPKEKKRRIDKEGRQTPSKEAASSHRHSKEEKRKSELRDDDDDLHSLSSIFSDSDKSLNNDRDEFDRKRNKDKQRSPPSAFSRKRSRSGEQHRTSGEGSERGRPEQSYQQHKQSSYSLAKATGSSQSRSAAAEHDEKKPIKMTFMRKQSSLKKGDGFESGGESSDPNDEFSLYGNSKDVIITKSASSTPSKATATAPSSREDLLKRLKEIDEAIARKRSKV